MARDPSPAPDRVTAVRDPRTNRRSAMGSIGRAQATASRRSRGGRTASFRAASAAARARGRDGARGVPLVVIQRQFGHANLGITSLPPGHRQQRDHQHRPRTALTDHLRQRWSPDQEIDPDATGPAAEAGRPDRTLSWRTAGAWPGVGQDSLSFSRGYLSYGDRDQRSELGAGSKSFASLCQSGDAAWRSSAHQTSNATVGSRRLALVIASKRAIR